MKKKKTGLLIVLILLMVFTTACSSPPHTPEDTTHKISEKLTFDSSLQLDYANGFSVDYYEDGYTLLTISGEERFLVVPEGGSVPEDLETDITTLKQPIANVYMATNAVMDMYRAMEALEDIRWSGTKAEDWYIEDTRAAMENGTILYAGKYNAPDYEGILAEGCSLSVQSSMIDNAPEVREKLEGLGIPVLVDRSNYEEHPLGRAEWVKLYGVLAQKEDKAKAVFREQKEIMEKVAGGEATGKTVVFFYITSDGTVNVRKPADYISKMIELAGGSYMFSDMETEKTSSSNINMQMEEFYAKAKDADYIIYNSTMGGEISSIEDLLEKSALLKDFKSVQDGNVWCTLPNLYQDSMGLGSMVADMHTMLTTEGTGNETLSYLQRLE